MEGLCISNQLYGAEFGHFRLMNRRNDGECLLFRLAARIPATKVVAYRKTSLNNLEDFFHFIHSLDEKRGKA